MNRTSLPTRTDTVRIPVVADDPDTTVELAPPWLLPAVTVTYGSPRRRLRDTALSGHLLAASRSAFYPAVIGCGLILGATAVVGGVL